MVLKKNRKKLMLYEFIAAVYAALPPIKAKRFVARLMAEGHVRQVDNPG